MTEPKQIAAVSNEPVAWLYSHKYHDKVFAEADRADMDPQYWTETPLYAHPPTVERETNRIDITPSLLLCRMNDQLAAKDARIEFLKERGAKVVVAYHVAICSPKGIVPMDEFYDPELAAKIDRDMGNIHSALPPRDKP